ncbi:hypothetical protein ACOSQ2_018255 [Xanthoceras sorbifolium]
MTNSNPTVASSSSSSAPQVTLMGTTNNNTNQSPSLIAINSTQVLIKLTKGGNYAAWRSQFENLLFGYDLIGYLDGTKSCPSASISASTFASVSVSPGDTNGQEPDRVTANPDHQIWLLSCMGAAQSIVTRSTTSAQAWAKLEVTYANRSNTRKFGLLNSLTNTIVDNLELIGHSVNDGAIVIHTLNGLGSAYMSLASAIHARDTPITFEELYEKLLDHEFNQRSLNRQGCGQQGNFSPHNGQHQQFGYNNS